MRILSFKPGHDGSIACLEDGSLKFLFESEKDSFHRFSRINPTTLLNAFGCIDDIPDVIGYSGWIKGDYLIDPSLEAGYGGIGTNSITTREIDFLSNQIQFFSSSHERSHIMSGYGMSPFPQGEPCYLLLWEGEFGDFYEIDSTVGVKRLGRVLSQPGTKYAYLYIIAHEGKEDMTANESFRLSAAGKVMALAAFADDTPIDADEKQTIDYVLNNFSFHKTKMSDLAALPHYKVGIESQRFKNLAGKFSDRLFEIFWEFAKKNCTKKYPLIITGGCGLNCGWNTKWKNSGLFRDVFIPPVTNDTGAALGTAIDAMYYFTGNAKIKWDVYRGEEFIHDMESSEIKGYQCKENFSFKEVANFLADDKIIAWMQGRCEIGPRALGNRSIIASPFKSSVHSRLNQIKIRENYRPIAPICLEEDVSKYFHWDGPSRFMLHFQKVKSKDLKAVTHVDNSARVQTVSQESNPLLHKLLSAFKDTTGVGVLCNTSLNFKGRGFINRTSDAVKYVDTRDLDGFVIGNKFYIKN